MDVLDSAGTAQAHDAPHMLCQGLRKVLSASSVAVLLSAGGQALTRRAAAGEPFAADLLRQLEAGPWRQTRSQRWPRLVVLPDVRVPGRWPALRGAALRSGALSLAIAPLRAARHPLGVLALSHPSAGGVATDEERAFVQSIADAAADHEQALRRLDGARRLAEQLQRALSSRVVVEQAKGFLAARLRTTPEAAFEVLRGYARPRNRRLHEVARALLDGSLDPESLR